MLTDKEQALLKQIQDTNYHYKLLKITLEHIAEVAKANIDSDSPPSLAGYRTIYTMAKEKSPWNP